jgi:hypothetical protein
VRIVFIDNLSNSCLVIAFIFRVIGICKYFDFHESDLHSDQPVTIGFCQPPGGQTF